MTRWLSHVVWGLVLVLVVVPVGCTLPQPRVVEEVYVPRFDFEPPSKAPPASADVTFAPVSPQFSAGALGAWGGPDSTPPMLRDFQNAMEADFSELLSAKGFTVRGPFASYMEMTFPDKKGSDLVLVVNIEVMIRDAGTRPDRHVFLLGPNTFTFEGTAELGGRISLYLSESLSNERMWAKSVSLPSKRVPWKGTQSWQNPGNPNAIAIAPPPFCKHFSDAGFVKAVGKELEVYYRSTMDSAWRYLSPEEMSLVKSQSQEIRRKKVY